MIPILLKPKLLGIANRWKRQVSRRSKIVQDLVIIAFCIGLMILIYTGAHDVLVRTRFASKLIYLPASQPLSLILLPLFAMLLFSNCVIAIGSLFLGSDLELLLSSPLTPLRFFYGKFCYIMFNSSWMPFMFMAPVLLAFGITYHAPLSYYAIWPLLLIPYFLIPSALAMFVAVVFTIIIPANRTKEILLLCLLLILFGVYQLIDILGLSGRNISNFEEIVRLVSLFSMSNLYWLPSNWVASCLKQLLEPDGSSWLAEVLLLYCCTAMLISLAYMSLEKLHGQAYSKARNIKQKVKLSGQNLRNHLNFLLPSLAPPKQALLTKEYRMLVREVTQVVQLSLLLVLCLIYIYNLRIFGTVEALPEDIRADWKNFFFIGNVAMGAFIATAICTRFVFPSVSLEGRAYWLLVSGPMDIAELIKTKFWFWFTPISIVSAAFFAAGAYIIGASPFLIGVNVVSAMIICYGIVGLGIGLGALFADFDWEHSTELAASFGSFIYMLLSIFLILCSIVPAAVLVLLRLQGIEGGQLTETQWMLCSLVGAILLCSLNYLAARTAIKTGELALIKRMEF